MHRSLSSALVAVTALAGVAAMSPAAASAASGPVASASYGRAEVVLQQDSSRAGRLQLAYAATPDAAPVVVDAELPAGIKARGAAVGLGLDATGLLTAVIESPKGIHWVHVTRPADGVRRLARTAGGASPAIFKGRVAYVCEDGVAICQASLRTASRKVVHREPKGSQWRIADVRIGKGDALAIAAERDGALGASRVQVKHSGGTPKTIAEANLDGGREVLLADVSPAGDHLNVIKRSFIEDGEPVADPKDTIAVFTFPGGKPRG